VKLIRSNDRPPAAPPGDVFGVHEIPGPAGTVTLLGLDRGGAEVACIRVRKGLCGTDVQEIMKTLVAAAEEIEHWLAERPRTPLEVVR
jgi:hypothetical protein